MNASKRLRRWFDHRAFYVELRWSYNQKVGGRRSVGFAYDRVVAGLFFAVIFNPIDQSAWVCLTWSDTNSFYLIGQKKHAYSVLLLALTGNYSKCVIIF